MRLASWPILAITALGLALNAATPAGAVAQTSATSGKAPPASKSQAVQLAWDDLMPPGEEERIQKLFDTYWDAAKRGEKTPLTIEEGSADDKMVQIGTFNTVDALNNQRVRIPGYVVPFDFNASNTYQDFLLVPYFGACIHVPPPPPNQIIYVKAKAPVKFKDIWVPVFVEGVLTTARYENDLGNAAYSLALTKVTPYEK